MAEIIDKKVKVLINIQIINYSSIFVYNICIYDLFIFEQST